jgi:BirA family biotin operon repressor/biotin-[acetyl-CoA-carboxylase] ligase
MHSTPPSIFDLQQLEAALAGTLFAGKLHFAPITDSTNTDALEAARAGAPHGSVYFSDEQLAGRGRGNHSWHSAAGQGLYVSVLLRPPIPAVRLPLLPLAAGLAAAQAIRATTHLEAGREIDLRWPNDLLITYSNEDACSSESAHSSDGPRKVGGILVEGKTEASGVAYAVVGIGINVHQRSFAPDLATPATSLDLESSEPVSRQTLLVALLKSLEHEALGLVDPTAAQTIPRRVQAASTWVHGRSVTVHGPQACTGVTAGLDENGFLLVETASGRVTVQTGGLRAAAIS